MKRAILLSIVLLAAAILIVYCAALPVAAPATMLPTPAPPPTTAPATIPPTPVPSPTTVPATRPPTSLPPSITAAPVVTITPPVPVVLAPCPIIATRTPPPGAPTYVPGGPNPPRGPVDPHVEVCGSPSTVRVGETVTLTAKPVDIGLPYFMLRVKDDEQSDYTQVVQVTYDNRIQGPTKATALLELVSAKGSMYEATFVLRALHTGTAIIFVDATGEIHFGYPGPATWAGGGSEPVVVKIVDK